MSKIEMADLIAELKEENGVKVTTSFRLLESDFKKFKEICEASNVKPSAVLEKLVKQFINASR